MSSGTCRIWWDSQVSAYRMSAPYNKSVIEFLKLQIPFGSRDYNTETKIWTFSENFFDAVKRLCEKMYSGGVTVVTKQQTQAATTPPMVAKASMDDVYKQFVMLLSADALAAAYRRAATEFHPDKGGSMDKMTSLNALWARIKEAKGVK